MRIRNIELWLFVLHLGTSLRAVRHSSIPVDFAVLLVDCLICVVEEGLSIA